MESQIGWITAIILIAIAATHIAEEAVAGFRSFFNTQWFGGNGNCPVTHLKGVVVDEIGLLAVLSCLAVGAGHDARWMLVAMGVITADLVQHVAFSVVKKGYTPGVATTVLYLAFVAYFFAQPELRGLLEGFWAWAALVLGVLFIASNYLFARWKVRRGDCQPAGAEPRPAVR